MLVRRLVSRVALKRKIPPPLSKKASIAPVTLKAKRVVPRRLPTLPCFFAGLHRVHYYSTVGGNNNKDEQPIMTPEEFESLSKEKIREIEQALNELDPLLMPSKESEELTLSVMEEPGGVVAHKLFNVASTQGKLNEVFDEIRKLYSAFRKNKEVREILDNIKMQDANKVPTIVSKNLDSSGVLTKPSAQIQLMLGWLIEDQMMDQMLDVMKCFLLLMKSHRRETEAEVITATPLSQGSLQYFTNLIKLNLLGPDFKVAITNKVDPSIGGGYILNIGDIYRDDNSWKSGFKASLEELQAKYFKPKEIDPVALISDRAKQALQKMLADGNNADPHAIYEKSVLPIIEKLKLN